MFLDVKKILRNKSLSPQFCNWDKMVLQTIYTPCIWPLTLLKKEKRGLYEKLQLQFLLYWSKEKEQETGSLCF